MGPAALVGTPVEHEAPPVDAKKNKLMTDLLPYTTISAVVSNRNAAVSKAREAADMIAAGLLLAEEAQTLAQQAHGATTFTLADHSRREAYQKLFQSFDADQSVECFRQQTDARTWMNLITLTGMNALMDKTAKDELYAGLCGAVPEITEDNIEATFLHLVGDAKLIFQRGLARAFSGLDRRFKSHGAFKLGSRIILTNVFDDWGGWNYHTRMEDTMADIERVFAVLDGNKIPDPGALTRAIRKDRQGGWYPRQSVTETPYFRVMCYKNGNAHLWFQRDDLVEKANQVLAEYYGEVLPDGVPDDMPVSDIKTKSGALCKDLAFYPTPDAVVNTILSQSGVFLTDDSVILEPSAGTGNLVRGVLSKNIRRVDAVEIHPDRVRALKAIDDPRLNVLEANFLRMGARQDYTHVFMNPPFYGTHWMEHVTHAFDFLVPGGTLVAILPISAELGTSTKHQTFRKWAAAHTGWDDLRFTDLPAESFKDSGTRVNTVFLVLHKKR